MRGKSNLNIVSSLENLAYFKSLFLFLQCRVLACLWLLSGQIQRKKGKPEEQQNLSYRLLIHLVPLSHNSLPYLVCSRWAIFTLLTMATAIRSASTGILMKTLIKVLSERVRNKWER